MKNLNLGQGTYTRQLHRLLTQKETPAPDVEDITFSTEELLALIRILTLDSNVKIVEVGGDPLEECLNEPQQESFQCDENVVAVVDKYFDRAEKGFNKYGTTTERKDVDLLGWLNHLQEELMDATIYIERLKKEIK